MLETVLHILPTLLPRYCFTDGPRAKLPSRAANFLHTYACERTIEKTTDILAHLSRCLRLAHVAHPSYPYFLPSIPLLAIPPVLHDLLQRACNMNSGSCKKLKRSKPPLVAKASLCGDPHAGHPVTSFGGPQSLHQYRRQDATARPMESLDLVLDDRGAVLVRGCIQRRNEEHSLARHGRKSIFYILKSQLIEIQLGHRHLMGFMGL